MKEERKIRRQALVEIKERLQSQCEAILRQDNAPWKRVLGMNEAIGVVALAIAEIDLGAKAEELREGRWGPSSLPPRYSA